VVKALIEMKVGLHICRPDGVENYSDGKRFRFVVVDLDKSTSYPSNFVCMLPMQINGKKKSGSVFLQIFGDKSVEQARTLLNKALETEDDSEVKAEIRRRLKLLEPKTLIQIKCSGCGKLFQPRQTKRFQQNFCEDCMKKKFGNRE